MKLKKLEIFGFKSFADKEDFVFEPGITVIVGPNGCGKSNVMDAIKWILGEQSAKSLRGREMSDIIFGGSASRPAVGFAEASLTIANEEHLLPIEYEEVSISRRLYTSGESEYLINKNVCRLKDIRELFLGTGVGVNSYSIIEQGKVEALLQSNAQERRSVFEEAAGISKYKSRKKETLLKLEKSQQNLLRINDIIREVERQLRSLKIQATKARKYKEHCARLKELKIKLSLKNFRDLKEKKDDVVKDIGLLSEDCKKILSVIDSKEVEVLDFENQLNDIDQKTSEANAEIISIGAQITNNKDKINFCKEKLNDIEHQESNHKQDIDTLKRKIEENEINLINIRKDLENIEQSFNNNTEVLGSKEIEFEQINLEVNMLVEKVEEKKSKIMDIFHEQSKIQNEIGNQTTIDETLRNRKQKIEQSQSNIQAQTDLIGQNLQELKSKHLELTNEGKSLGNEQSGLKESIDNLDDAIHECNNLISQEEKLRSSKQSHLDVLEDYELRSEGVDAGARAILNEVTEKKETLAGIYGLVADIMNVELQYARAIETALGDLAQSVVTKSFDDGIKAINFLNKTDAGHATFLLLDKINNSLSSVDNNNLQYNNQQSYASPAESPIFKEIIGKASDLVKYDHEFKSVVDFLLNKTLVVQDFSKASALADSIYSNNENANLLRAQYGNIDRIVTLDGALIENTGVIKGGVIREKSGLILRKSEMESIRAEIPCIDQKIKELKEDKQRKIEELNNTKDSLDITTQKIEKLNIALLNNENEQKQEEQKLSKFKEEDDINASELKEIELNIESIARRNTELRNRLYVINEQHNELENEVDSSSEEITKKDELKASFQEEITNLKITIAQENEKKETYIQTLQQAEVHDKELRNQINAKSSGIEDCSTKRQKIINELGELEQNIKSLDLKKQTSDDLLNTLVGDRNKVFSQLADIKRDVDNHRTRHNSFEEQLNKLRLKENEYQVRATDLEERIFEEYNIRLPELDRSLRRAEDYNQPQENNAIGSSIERQATEGFSDTTCAQTTTIHNGDNREDEVPTIIDEEETDWDAVNVEIEELKRKIEKAGSVNLESINEQEEFEERYKFLTSQRNDLEESEKSLNDIIEKLNKTSRELFEKTFNDIKENFSIYFRKLFGGGRASIVLEDGGDILDAGIEIIIQPPNKEFKAIALFSGGEKVLITVALLFAILKSKPTPFCLMDEVDAALDENNIARFTTVLKEFALESQFVIISHNKKTMQIADVIYGVTMEEPGVSKKVAVKFDKFE